MVQVVTLKLPKQVLINRDRMIELVDTMEDTTPNEALVMLCFALSLLYRSAADRQEMTVIEFTDSVGVQIRSLITNPPQGFDDEPAPGCECQACKAKAEIKARAKARAN